MEKIEVKIGAQKLDGMNNVRLNGSVIGAIKLVPASSHYTSHWQGSVIIEGAEWRISEESKADVRSRVAEAFRRTVYRHV